MRLRVRMAATLAWLASTAVFGATDLHDAYLEALRNDADFGSAAAAFDASQEELPKGRAGLLPNVSITGVQTQNQTTQRSLTFLGMRSEDFKYTSSTYGISLRQALYRPYVWASYLQGQARVSYGEAQFNYAKQDLIVRTAGAYLDVLLAQDSLALLRAQKVAITEQLEQARKLFKGGEGSITDITDAQARYDVTAAQELDGLNSYEVARRSLERIIGHEPGPLKSLGPDMSVQSPEPNDLKQWIEWAQQTNPNVQAQRFGVDISSQDVTKASADHKPTVDLVASRNKSDSQNDVSINTRFDTSAIGVQVSIPLYAGGYVNANVRQADAKLRQARQDLEATLRKVTLDTRQNFLGVNNGIAQIKAYQQAVTSNEAALVATRKSFQGGLRTNLDILNAQQQLYSSKRDLAKARYTYILTWLKLKADVGTLGEDDVQFVNRWMTAPPVDIQ